MSHTTFPKPHRGEAKRERHDRRSAVETYRRGEKAKAKTRDGHRCRWPGCDCARISYRPVLESAHLIDLSLGGTDEASNLVTICAERHRGTPSLHGKDLRVEAVHPRLGADGPLIFYRRHGETGQWLHVATERYVGEPETRGA